MKKSSMRKIMAASLCTAVITLSNVQLVSAKTYLCTIKANGASRGVTCNYTGNLGSSLCTSLSDYIKRVTQQRFAYNISLNDVNCNLWTNNVFDISSIFNNSNVKLNTNKNNNNSVENQDVEIEDNKKNANEDSNYNIGETKVNEDNNVKDDIAKDNVVKEDNIKDDIVKDNSAKEDTVKDDIIEDNSAKEDTVKDDIIEDNSTKEDSVKDDSTKINSNVQANTALEVLASEVINLTNQERAKNGLAPLSANSKLSSLASLKSEDMISKNYFSHVSPTYGSPSDMLKSNGVEYSFVGENIAYGQKTAKEVVDSWMNSPGHRANILSENFEEIGVGVAKASNGQYYWTQIFMSAR